MWATSSARLSAVACAFTPAGRVAGVRRWTPAAPCMAKALGGGHGGQAGARLPCTIWFTITTTTIITITTSATVAHAGPAQSQVLVTPGWSGPVCPPHHHPQAMGHQTLSLCTVSTMLTAMWRGRRREPGWHAP